MAIFNDDLPFLERREGVQTVALDGGDLVDEDEVFLVGPVGGGLGACPESGGV